MQRLQQEHLETLRAELFKYITEEDLHFRTKENQVILPVTFIETFIKRVENGHIPRT